MSLLKVFKLNEELFYHGSPYGGLSSFENVKPPIFFTKKRSLAKSYATQHRLGAQTDPGGVADKQPTVYKVDLDPGNVLDFRQQSIKDAYSEIRKKELQNLPKDDWWQYPAIDQKGFLSVYSGLPVFGQVISILDLFAKHGKQYNSVWIDEGSDGISLAVIHPKGRIQILDQENP